MRCTFVLKKNQPSLDVPSSSAIRFTGNFRGTRREPRLKIIIRVEAGRLNKDDGKYRDNARSEANRYKRSGVQREPRRKTLRVSPFLLPFSLSFQPGDVNLKLLSEKQWLMDECTRVRVNKAVTMKRNIWRGNPRRGSQRGNKCLLIWRKPPSASPLAYPKLKLLFRPVYSFSPGRKLFPFFPRLGASRSYHEFSLGELGIFSRDDFIASIVHRALLGGTFITSLFLFIWYFNILVLLMF